MYYVTYDSSMFVDTVAMYELDNTLVLFISTTCDYYF